MAPAHRTLLVLEPALVHAPPAPGMDARVSAAIDRLADATDAAVVVYPYGGTPPERVHAHLMDADVTALGHDFIAAPDDALYTINEYRTTDEVAMGILPIDGPWLGARALRNRTRSIVEAVPAQSFETIHLLPDSPLRGVAPSALSSLLAPLAQACADPLS